MSRLADDLRAIADRVEALPREFVRSAERIGPDVVEAEVRNRRGTTSVGRLGRLDVRATGRTAGRTGSVELVGTGPWGLVDRGAKAHPIAKASGLATRHGVFDRVSHPGTRGLGIWPDAEREVDRRLGDRFGELFDTATRS